jgi:uncharacterized protein YcbK (DUF882 family)
MGTSKTDSCARPDLSRRKLLCAGAAVAGLFALKPTHALAAVRPRLLAFENLHTGERMRSEYWVNGGYMPDALEQIAHVLRDHRTDATHPISIGLLDVLFKLQNTLATKAPFQVISGYRSPQTNAKLAGESQGVATRSLHMEGMAIDIRVPGVELKNLHKAAKSLNAGGVGYYAQSNFVHVDVGRVRYW